MRASRPRAQTTPHGNGNLPLPLAKIPHLYFVHPVEGRDRDGRPVHVDFRVDVSRVFATKRQMLACHASQRNWLLRQHGIDEYLAIQEKWGGIVGAEIGVAQAEAFRQYRGHPYPQDNLLLQLLAQDGRGTRRRRLRGMTFISRSGGRCRPVTASCSQ